MGRNKQISDEAILNAAREVFVKQGYGTSTREIAKSAGISEAVLYQRFKTKLDLFFSAMIPPPVNLPGDHGDSSCEGFQPEFEDLAIEIMNYFRKAMPVIMQLVTHPSFDLNDLDGRKGQLPVHGLAEAITRCLTHHLATGAITASPEMLQAATLTLISTFHSLALFERMGVHGGSFPDPVIRGIVRLISAGLLAGEPLK